MMRKLKANRGAGDLGKFALAQHPEGGLTVKELNTLFALAKILGAASASAGNLLLQEFHTVVPAGGTDDVTFSDTVDVCSILGGIMSVENVDADYEFDLGYTGNTNGLIDDFNAGAVEDKELVIPADYLATTEDIILTITSNSNTVPVTVYIAILTVKLVTA
jgi:hypothetical protein